MLLCPPPLLPLRGCGGYEARVGFLIHRTPYGATEKVIRFLVLLDVFLKFLQFWFHFLLLLLGYLV